MPNARYIDSTPNPTENPNRLNDLILNGWSPSDSDANWNAGQLQEQNPNALILSPSLSGKQTNADNMAKVHRAEWQDYLDRFAPVENMLFDKFNDAEGRAASVEKAGLTMGNAFDRSREQTDMNMSRYGLNISPTQQTKRDNEFALEKAKGVAGAKNAMRTSTEDQRMSIMSGGLSNVKQQNQGG